MSGDPAVKERLEKALAEVAPHLEVKPRPEAIGQWAVGQRYGTAWHPWTEEEVRLVFRARCLAGLTLDCCERCYVEDVAGAWVAFRPSSDRRRRCAAGDCPHGNEPGAFDRSAAAS